MFRTVFDTNVYISALVFGGKPEALLRLSFGRSQKVELYTSHTILKETARILASEKFLWPRSEIAEAVSFVVKLAEVVEPKKAVAVCVDEADNRVLECAIEAKADYIISGDRHLIDLEKFEDIPILKPAEYLEMLTKSTVGRDDRFRR